MLNNKDYLKVFKNEDYPKEEVMLVYKIYFTLFKSDDDALKNEKRLYKFWDYAVQYFKNGEMGKIVEEDFKNLKNNQDIFLKVSNMVENKQHKLTPNYFTSLCGTTGLLIFILKDILEWAGIISDKKPVPSQLLALSNYAIEYYKSFLSKLSN